jgi:hypothetical protein
MHVHRAGTARIVVTPYGQQQPVARKYAAPVFQQEAQQRDSLKESMTGLGPQVTVCRSVSTVSVPAASSSAFSCGAARRSTARMREISSIMPKGFVT